MISGIYRPWEWGYIVNTHLRIIDKWVYIYALMLVRRHALVTTLSLLSQFVYLGTKFVVAHLLCLSSLLFSSKLLKGYFPPLEQFVTWNFAKSERREGRVRLELELQDPIPRNPGSFIFSISVVCLQRWESVESCPRPSSPYYFHWALLFWLQFAPQPGVKTCPKERKMQALLPAAGGSHCPPCS